MQESTPVTVRPAYREEWNYAMALAYDTFMQFDAKDYTEEGIRAFYEFVTDERMRQMFLNGEYYMLLAVKDDVPVGMITLRARTHISLLFVKAEYHKQGVGRLLMQAMQQYVRGRGRKMLTVNSSPYAVGFYKKLGFYKISSEMEERGIRYTPMKWDA